MRIVDLPPLDLKIGPQARGKLRREAGLHGTAVRFFVAERGGYSLSVFHIRYSSQRTSCTFNCTGPGGFFPDNWAMA
jgi:hypothetical protein